jgi:hypothetical protein
MAMTHVEIEQVFQVRIFQKHETYLMKLPEDGPKYGPKYVSVIKYCVDDQNTTHRDTQQGASNKDGLVHQQPWPRRPLWYLRTTIQLLPETSSVLLHQTKQFFSRTPHPRVPCVETTRRIAPF